MFDGAKVVIVIGKGLYIIRITIFILEKSKIVLGVTCFFVYLHQNSKKLMIILHKGACVHFD